MSKATLVIMAAGIGSRFGGGIKQLAPIGPNGEIIMDYSIYDALEAGFDKVVFVIRKDLEKDFKEIIGNRIEKEVEVAYAFQELDDIPEKFSGKFTGRTKPWGTGQAILCCKDVVDAPFLVINADDYYGKEAFKEAYSYLTNLPSADIMQICMVSFVLKNTLSDNGGVTRGVCEVDGHGMLADIKETHNIEKEDGKAVIHKEDGDVFLDVDSPVSMNMWGITPEFFEILNKRVISYPRNPLFPALGLHTMIADKTGDAFILEEGNNTNIVSTSTNDFIIMTNFPNGDFDGIIILNYLAKPMIERFNTIACSENADIYLINKDGYFLSSKNPYFHHEDSLK